MLYLCGYSDDHITLEPGGDVTFERGYALSHTYNTPGTYPTFGIVDIYKEDTHTLFGSYSEDGEVEILDAQHS